jgi:small GTP-binding protein
MIKDSELRLIKELEKEIGWELKENLIERIGRQFIRGFATDETGNIAGLGLNFTNIKSTPFILPKFRHLKTLSCIGNGMKNISTLQGMSQLRELYLRDNYLTDISALQGLNQLTLLDLSDNQLTDISALQGLSQLKELYLYNNKLTDISALQGLSQLTRLELRENKISQLPEAIAVLGMEIDVDRDFFGNGIRLYGNPIESPPLEIIRKGKAAIRAYFKSLKKGKLPLNEVKVLLVGDGGAGKTSLVKRLNGKRFNKKEAQTHGININRIPVKSGKVRINANLWDFGGQEIMHATHQFFLSKRSLYILVLDGRRDEKTEYWLKHIGSFGGDSPVLVVLNKIDENPGFELNRKYLMEKYSNILGFYRISCANNRGIKSFYKAMAEALKSVEIIRTTWANNWFNVKTRLEKMAENFIGYDKYKKICDEEKITDDTAIQTLVDFLNDLGVILHFKDFQLQGTHILEPRWVTEAVYKIINSPILAKAKGILELCQLDTILKQKKESDFFYPSDKYRFIIALMKKFELCYEIDKDNVLVPDLLAVEESEFNFDYKDCLRLEIDYDFLPRSVMPRFIVRMHKDIKDQCRWRTGVVLENNGYKATAVVKADNEEKKIFVYVTGEQKRDYFSVIRHNLGDINDDFKKLQAIEKVPLPDYPEIAVEYRELIGLEKMGKEFIAIGKLGRDIPIKLLLNGIESEDERRMKTQYPKYIIENKGTLNIVDSVEEGGQVAIANIQVEQGIQQLIELLKKDNTPGNKELITQLQDETVKKDRGKLRGVLGKVLTRGAEIAAIASTVSQLL